jgi:hypothetical protein
MGRLSASSISFDENPTHPMLQTMIQDYGETETVG